MPYVIGLTVMLTVLEAVVPQVRKHFLISHRAMFHLILLQDCKQQVGNTAGAYLAKEKTAAHGNDQ